MKVIENYLKAMEGMVDVFCNTYYKDDEGHITDYYMIGVDWDRLHPWPVEIHDRYWSMDNIYEALLNKIPKDKLFEWYDYSYAKHFIKKEDPKYNEPIINLTTFCLWDRVYTKEEREEDERKIEETWYSLRDSINRHRDI